MASREPSAARADYWWLCWNCGGVSPADRWKGDGDSATCPVCGFTHADDDQSPGVSDGTFVEMQAEREKWEASRVAA